MFCGWKIYHKIYVGIIEYFEVENLWREKKVWVDYKINTEQRIKVVFGER